MRVEICVATCKRPQLLGQLLARLPELRFQKNPTPDIRIHIVDNDAAGSAETICRAAQLPWPLHYVIEPRRGIASARNRALTVSREADCVVFIDDDESPSAFWLDELLWAQAAFKADVVMGPVLPILDQNIPDWIQQGSFFTRALHDSGKVLHWFATNNTLIMRRVIDRFPAFDERFQLTGGEDLQYSMKVYKEGFKIVFAKDAIVTEAIDKERASVGNILKRAYQGGNCQALAERSLDASASARLKRVGKGSVRVVQGLGAVALSALRGRATALHSMRKVFLGAGMIAGMAGIRFEPYKNIKGQSTA